DTERCIARRKVGVGKRSYEMEVSVVPFHYAVTEIVRIDEAPLASLGNGESLVDRSLRGTVHPSGLGVIHHQNSVMEIDRRVPATDRAIFGVEDEKRRAG